MSYNNVRHIRASGVGDLVDYLLHGKGEEKQRRLAEGVTRAAYVRCDHPDGPWGFAAACVELPTRYTRRKNGCDSVVQSFSAGEFDPDNSGDVERVNQLGYALAKRLAPGADCLVVTHADTDCLHNHILIMNHDKSTCKAVNLGNVYAIREANNDQMREAGLSVIGDAGDSWALTREKLEADLLAIKDDRKRTSIERQLYIGDSIAEGMRVCSDVNELEEWLSGLDRPIRVKRTKKNGEPLSSVKYETQYGVSASRSNTWRGVMASGLCGSFELEALNAFFAKKQEEADKDKGKNEIGPLWHSEKPETRREQPVMTSLEGLAAAADKEKPEERRAAVTAGHVDRFPKPWTVQLSEKVLDKRIEDKTRELSRWRAFLATVRGVFEGIAELVAGAPRSDREAKQAAADALAEELHEREDWGLR